MITFIFQRSFWCDLYRWWQGMVCNIHKQVKTIMKFWRVKLNLKNFQWWKLCNMGLLWQRKLLRRQLCSYDLWWCFIWRLYRGEYEWLVCNINLHRSGLLLLENLHWGWLEFCIFIIRLHSFCLQQPDNGYGGVLCSNDLQVLNYLYHSSRELFNCREKYQKFGEFDLLKSWVFSCT